MAYNKAKEEKKWRLWKEAEEKQLRNLGVTEDDIEQLRIHDWAIFNSDRRYYQRVQETGTYLDELAEDTTQPEVKTVEDFLDSIMKSSKSMLLDVKNVREKCLIDLLILLNITWRQEKIMTRLFTQYVNLQMRRG